MTTKKKSKVVKQPTKARKKKLTAPVKKIVKAPARTPKVPETTHAVPGNRNEEIRFLRGDDGPAKETWRTFRIMAEFVNGLETLSGVTKGVSMFGSARLKPGSKYYELATKTGYEMGKKGFTVITGGGPGAMEASNKGARQAKAKSFGLNIKLPFETHINPYVDDSCDFNFFFVRKVMLVKYSQAFVILPGGMGTMDEMFEALTLIQTGKVENFPIILMGKTYWSGLIDWLKNTMYKEGMISDADFEHIHMTDDPKVAAKMAEQHWKQYLKSLKRELV